MRPAAEAEKLGIPAVVVTTTGFTSIARAAARAQGLSDVRIAEYPGPVGVHADELIVKNVEEVLFPRIVEQLTKAATEYPAAAIENERRRQPAAGGAGAARGDSGSGAAVCEGSFEEINRYFREREWSDDLPLVPPTMDRVESFLEHTARAPDEHIAVLPQANLIATPLNIAANAVMAGCRPDAMPLLIAAVEAIAENRYNLNNIGTTWGVLPFLLINGPRLERWGIETGGQLVSRGENRAIGRALGLIIRNIAGYRLGRNYMGTFGYPLSFVIAENDAENPWEPYHVEHGFSKDDTAVTACGTVTWGWPPAIYGADRTAAQTALRFLALEARNKPCLARLAERGPNGFQNMITLLIAPPVAKALAAEGYSKQKIREYVYENARVPYEELEFLLKYGHSEAFTIPAAVERGLYPEEYLGKQGELLRVIPSPETVHVVVCGDPNRNRVMVLWGGYVNPVTKKVEHRRDAQR
ncbi:MAG: hypothetical protein IT530_12595 [Burkholderiales bacterium]|nr:hypothetical protein [Burkholderiales bacterium]